MVKMVEKLRSKIDLLAIVKNIMKAKAVKMIEKATPDI